MFFWMVIKVALKSLAANKMRSILAMLGIIIGVASVVATLAIGTGAKAAMMERFAAMGTNLLFVRPAQRGFGGVMSGTQQNLTVEDAQAIVNSVNGVKQVSPAVSGSAQVKFYEKNTRTTVMGVAVTYFPIRDFEVDRGSPFTDAEAEGRFRVAVVGSKAAEDLFGVQEPVGQNIKINGISFRVTGILKAKGDQGWFNPDDQILVPYTTAMKELFGVDYVREIDIQCDDGANLDTIQKDVENVLRERHRIPAGADEDFSIMNQADMIANMTSMMTILSVLLGTVGGISLFVGGIGIMNIMLVTVTERTREIGVRKAIGAKDRDVLRQFLIESVLMSGVGGLIGLALGGAASWILRNWPNSPFAPRVEAFAIALAMSFALGVGVFFGFYPAYRASQLDPIEALRYE